MIWVLVTLKLPVGLKFRTYETEHYLIHYSLGNEAWVPKVAYLAESLYTVYEKIFNWSPSKINVVLTDVYDFSNGFSTPIFENTVYLYLQPPVGDPYFGSMEGWIEELLKHELVHTFHLDKPHTWNGLPLPSLLRFFLGRHLVTFPNLFDPSWQTEGLATYYESKSAYGRLNNRYFRDQMLSYVRDGGRITPDMMSSVTDEWPFGKAYLFGGMFLENVIERKGEEEVVDMVVNSSYSEDILSTCSLGLIPGPYLLRDMREFRTWKRELERKAKGLKSIGYRYVTRTGNEKGYVSLSPSGEYVAYTETTPYEHPSLKVMDMRKRKVIRKVKAYAVGPVSWMGDSVVLFARYEVIKNFYIFSDIYSLNVETGKVKRLTKGERAYSPVSTPYGIIYVRREGTKRSIVKLGGGVLFRGKEGEGFTDLKFYKDTLFFTYYRDGWTDVGYLPYGEDSIRLITQTREMSLLSHVDSTGIYFTENFTPYLFKDGFFWKLSNNPLSLLYPQPYGDSLLVLAMRGKGLDLALTPRKMESASLPKDFKSPKKIPYVDLSKSRPYNPLPHILPKFWSPVLTYGKDSSSITLSGGFFTAGSDVLYRHSYLLSQQSALTVTDTDTIITNTVRLDYSYDALYPTLEISTQALAITESDLKIGKYAVDFQSSLLFPFNHIDGREYIGAFLHTRKADSSVWSFGLRGGITRAQTYKRTSTLMAEGFSLNASLVYSGKLGYSAYGNLAFRRWLLFNLRFMKFSLPYSVTFSPYVYPLYHLVTHTLMFASLSVYPDVFSPSFPDLNVSLLPPSPWAFYSILSLSRLYPSIELSSYDSNIEASLGLNADLVLFGNLPTTLSVMYTFYPYTGVKVSLR